MIYFQEKQRQEIIEHARVEKPNEACGMVAGVRGRAVKIFRGTNVDANRRVRYSMDPKEILKVWKEIDDNDWELLCIYHSHPHTQAYPSATDVSLAFYPESTYVIVSLMDQDNPVMRAFRIVDGQINEEEIGILPDE
ncbi:MAG: M67 family metallopeptidase [Chloroflexi bacterium]|nr:M67 family metallopeptidase [Chloroflexota bacterium]